MEFVQSEWRVLLSFNQVFVVVKTPLTNTVIDEVIQEALMQKIVGNIEKAEAIGESKTLNSFPNEVQEVIDSITKEGYTITSFGVMFKDHTKAKEFVSFLRQQG